MPVAAFATCRISVLLLFSQTHALPLTLSAPPLSSNQDQVDLEEFIKLYVNYRPVFGLGKKQFRAAFRTLRKQMAHPDTTTTTTTTTATTTTAAAAGDMANTNASIATVYLDEEGLEAQPDQDPLVDLGEADEALSLERNELLEKLVNLGEQMSVGEIAGVFKTLLGNQKPKKKKQTKFDDGREGWKEPVDTFCCQKRSQ